MFIGHYGIAFALKKYETQISLGVLFIAVQFVDIVWTILIMAGVEKVAIEPGIMAANPLNFLYYPFTHSLLATVAWGVLIYFICLKLPIKTKIHKARFAGILAVAVSSHFLLDLITHRPDLPLAGNDSPMLGFGLWNFKILSYVIEALIFIAGLVMYYRATIGQSFGARYGMIIFAVFLLIMNGINLFGPPPPNVNAIAATGFVGYLLFAAIAFWLDKKRSA